MLQRQLGRVVGHPAEGVAAVHKRTLEGAVGHLAVKRHHEAPKRRQLQAHELYGKGAFVFMGGAGKGKVERMERAHLCGGAGRGKLKG
eukprot:351202-Chlamydomonas_euryale.AAC.3